jgi:hypothetical protein
MKRWVAKALVGCGVLIVMQGVSRAAETAGIPPLPEGAKLALEEDWREGKIDPARWYVMRRHWGNGHHGVVPENVRVTVEKVAQGKDRSVLVCTARGDQYEGPVRGLWNKADRTGGVIASKAFFASGRFEVEMRIGGTEAKAGGPADPTRPIGTIPAIWLYAGRNVRVPEAESENYVAREPLYQPYLQEWGKGNAYYTSEIDFPELGNQGDFAHALYNTFLNKRTESLTVKMPFAPDGRFHTYTTEWRTGVVELPGLRDDQVLEHDGHWWVRDLQVKWDTYWGAPLKKLGQDQYALLKGVSARHWVDGKLVAEHTRDVPSMAAQLTLGVWLPNWAGPAPWEETHVTFGKVRIWQYGDPGDVHGFFTQDCPNNIGKDGAQLKVEP